MQAGGNSGASAAGVLYTCATCGLAVAITPSGAVRGCKHGDAAIVAHARATVQGRGGLTAGK